jgi:hypothetical protein
LDPEGSRADIGVFPFADRRPVLFNSRQVRTLDGVVFEFELDAPLGRTYTIESATEFGDWMDWTTVVHQVNPEIILDPAPSTGTVPKRFYRVR